MFVCGGIPRSSWATRCGGLGGEPHASLASSSNQIARPHWSLSSVSQLSSSLPLPSIPFSRGLLTGVLLPPLLVSLVLSILRSRRSLSKPQILPHHPLLRVQTPGLGFYQLSPAAGSSLTSPLPVHTERLAHCTRRGAPHLWAFAHAAASARHAPHSFVAWLAPTHPLRPLISAKRPRNDHSLRPKTGITSTGKSPRILFSILGQAPGSGLLIP